MTSQSAHGYSKSSGNEDMSQRISETAKDYADKALDVGQEALDAADEYLKPIGLSLKEKPMMTLAVFGGIAFVVGAFWMQRSSQRHTRWDELAAHLNDMARRSRWW
jgi:hypothetical protein